MFYFLKVSNNVFQQKKYVTFEFKRDENKQTSCLVFTGTNCFIVNILNDIRQY